MTYALAGTGIGPTFVGFASDHLASLAFGGDAYARTCAPGRTVADAAAACAAAARTGLSRALMLCVLAYGWGAVHYFLASRHLGRASA